MDEARPSGGPDARRCVRPGGTEPAQRGGWGDARLVAGMRRAQATGAVASGDDLFPPLVRSRFAPYPGHPPGHACSDFVGGRACAGSRLWKSETMPSPGPTGRWKDHRVVTVRELGRSGNATCPSVRSPSTRRPVGKRRRPVPASTRAGCETISRLTRPASRCSRLRLHEEMRVGPVRTWNRTVSRAPPGRSSARDAAAHHKQATSLCRYSAAAFIEDQLGLLARITCLIHNSAGQHGPLKDANKGPRLFLGSVPLQQAERWSSYSNRLGPKSEASLESAVTCRAS